MEPTCCSAGCCTEAYPFSLAHVGLYWIFFSGCILLFANTASIRIGALLAARREDRFDRPWQRIKRVLLYAFAQKRMFRDLYAGAFHILIFWGFVVLLLRSISLIGQGLVPGFDPGTFLGPLTPWYLLMKDVFEVLVLLAIAMAVGRRLFKRPARLDNSWDAYVTLAFIGGLMITDFFADAALIKMTAPDWAPWVPFSRMVSDAMSSLAPDSAREGFVAMWWAHMVILFGFLNFLPYSKHFHVLTSVFNVFFADASRNPPLKKIDLETEHFGTSRIQDLTWKQMLDLYTCTECGRCKEGCPTTITEKPLKPKEYGNDLRDYLYATPLADLAQDKPAPEGRPLVGGAISEDTIWACTTCGYCEHACPLLIKFVDKLTDMRKYLTLEESRFPEEAQIAFKGMERQGNPWNFPRADRMKWAEGLDVPVFSEKPDSEYLFWVGCAGAYEEHGKRVSRAFVKLLNAAGVSFAVLGEEESCTGDAARRLGNEYLFQSLAEANVETLKGHEVKKIVTNCPHCLQTLKNEYPEFGGNFEVVHGTQLVARLLREGRLTLRSQVDETLAFHDPCYLARYNEEVDAPRTILQWVPGLHVREMKNSHKATLCCGAGGGRMWLEEKLGTRINHARLKQAADTGAAGIAVACPFCNVMLNNAAGETGREGFQSHDVLELAARALGS